MRIQPTVLAIIAGCTLVTHTQAQQNVAYGRTVSIRSSYTRTFNNCFGNIQRYEINNNRASLFGTIYDGGDARNANISPDGNRVAFLRQDNKICIINIDGSGSVQVLGSITDGATGWLDWPMQDWVYYSPKWGRHGLHRINVNTGQSQHLGDLKVDNTWTISVSQDGSRACISAQDGGYNSHLVTIVNNQITSVSQVGACGGSISPDGALYTLNFGGHDRIEARRFTDRSKAAEWTTARCPSAGPNWNRHRWSSNSDDWVTLTQGEPYQMQDRTNQVLYYLPNNGQTCIQVTNNSNGTYNEGDDFWIQFSTEPSIGLNPSSLQFESTIDGPAPPAQNVSVANAGAGTLPTLSASSNRDWLTVALSGSGNSYTIRNTVDHAPLSGGVHSATVTVRGSGVDPASYSVQLTVVAPPVLTTVSVTDAYATPGGQVQCKATGYDQYDAVLDPQPQFNWTLAAGQGSITSGGLYTAPSTEGTASVRATGPNGVAGEGTIAISAVPPIHLQVDCGESPAAGWESEAPYLVGEYDWWPDFVFGGSVDVSGVSNAAPQAVYLSSPLGRTRNSYSFPDLPNASYRIRLHFMLGTGHNGTFNMDWYAEDIMRIDDLDIKAEAGGFDKALVKEILVDVEDGDGLQIHGINDGGVSVYVGGIEIESVGAPAPSGPAVTVISPNGGESFAVGETVDIQWQGDPDRVSAVMVEVSANEGEHWELISGEASIAAFADDSTGSFSWTVPAVLSGSPLESSRCLVRVTDYVDRENWDVSDAPFTLSGDTPTTVTSHDAEDNSVPAVAHVRGTALVSTPAGRHDVWIHNLAGQTIARYSGVGPTMYPICLGPTPPTVCIVRVRFGDREWTGRVVVE
ncbi:MAG: hypothetical protein GF331_02060 [Chitinivibrionales bacterium]|nr:hypothetical protein [Chitinivibrionales bacterium]